MTPEYVAGIIDGEGHVAVSKNTAHQRSYVGRVLVSMAMPVIVELLQARYGGSYRVYPRKGMNQRDAHTWEVKGRAAISILTELLPHLILKQNQAKAVLELYKLKDSASVRNHPTEEQKVLMESLHTATKLWNRRGK